MQHQKYKIQPFIYHSSGAKRRVVGLRSEEFPGQRGEPGNSRRNILNAKGKQNMNMKLPVSRIQCEPDRTYNKADDMHLRASIKSRLDKGLKPLLQPVALKKLENNPDYDYAVDDGRRRFLALLDFKFTELELGQDAILIDGDSEINAYLANQHTNLSLAEPICSLLESISRSGNVTARRSWLGVGDCLTS